MNVLEQQQLSNIKIEVVEYPQLQGSDNIRVAERVFFMNQSNIKAKMVRATLRRGGQLLIEPGALYFMQGNLELESTLKGGMTKALFRKFTSGETLFQSSIRGQGVVHLEPTLGHYVMMEVDQDGVIVDKGAFYCGAGDIEVSACLQRNVSSALFGGEGFFQTQIKGAGLVVLRSPVPSDEMQIVTLGKGEKLTVDGNFVVARTSSVQFRAEKSGKSLFQTLTSGELLLQTFTGPGVVMIAPTQPIYSNLQSDGSIAQGSAGGSSSGHRS